MHSADKLVVSIHSRQAGSCFDIPDSEACVLSATVKISAIHSSAGEPLLVPLERS